MGDKSPKDQIKIGNLTVKLNQNNQQRRKELNYDYDKNYHRDRYNDKYNKYNDKYNDKYKGKTRDRDYNNYYRNKNYRNKSRSRSKSKKYNQNKNNRNQHSKSKSRSRSKNHSHSHYYNNNIINNRNEQKDNVKNNGDSNDNPNNNQYMNQTQMNQMYQNYFNNYMNANKDYFKNYCQMNNINPNSNKVFIPIGTPVNYFYNQKNNNNKSNNNMSNNNQNNDNNIKKEKEKEEPSNTILITDLDTNITKEVLEDIFREKCLKLQISLPIDIRLVEALNIAYIIFPSITSCVVVYNSLLNQKILINGKYFPVQFSPNLTQKYNNNRDTLTYVTQISSNTNLTTSMETTIHEDWYCIYCNSKNFSRRIVCFKCQKPKSINSRVVPVIKQKKIILGKNGEILPNNSIIIQGKQIQCSNEGEVFNLFIFINFSY